MTEIIRVAFYLLVILTVLAITSGIVYLRIAWMREHQYADYRKK